LQGVDALTLETDVAGAIDSILAGTTTAATTIGTAELSEAIGGADADMVQATFLGVGANSAQSTAATVATILVVAVGHTKAGANKADCQWVTTFAATAAAAVIAAFCTFASYECITARTLEAEEVFLTNYAVVAKAPILLVL